MATKTQIAALALFRIGWTTPVTDIDNGTDQASIAIKTIWDPTVEWALRDFPWPFATEYKTLGLVAGSSSVQAVEREWTFSYRYPSQVVMVRRLVNPLGRNSTVPILYRIGRDATGKLVYTDLDSPVAECTRLITTPEEFDGKFASALAWRLAREVIPSLGQVKKSILECDQEYTLEKLSAQATALNEGQLPAPPDAAWIQDR